MLYKKLPTLVEAVVFNGTTTWDEAPQWLIDATQKHPSETGSLTVRSFNDFSKMDLVIEAKINTLEGVMTVSPGDYIIRGVNGELYPCKPDIFAKNYELADDIDQGNDELLTETRALATGLNKLNVFMASKDFPKLERPEKDLVYSQQRASSKLVQILGKRLELRGKAFTHK